VFSQHQLRAFGMNYKVWNLWIQARNGEALKQASRALKFYIMHNRAQGTLNLSHWFQPNSSLFLFSSRMFLKRTSITKAPLGALQILSTNTPPRVFSRKWLNGPSKSKEIWDHRIILFLHQEVLFYVIQEHAEGNHISVKFLFTRGLKFKMKA
jgi:hypothetical protein